VISNECKKRLRFPCLGAGVYDKSIETARKAIQIDPKYGGAYYHLGLTYEKMGDVNKAIAMEKKALEVDPAFSMAQYSLGRITFKTVSTRNQRRLSRDSSGYTPIFRRSTIY
jgi:tetratricopeptide (TPR) repeat protein